MSTWLTKAIVAPLAALAVLVSIGSAMAADPVQTTLRVELGADIDYVDPALSFYIPTWTIEYATCAKLLNYPDRGAPEGARLAPEVAKAMPTVSPDARTYTFHLRDDFFFSPPSGERVTAAHFKWAIDRALNRQMNSPAQPYLGDIEGAQAVIAGTTNSTSGVVADGDTLSITLVRPAGDFLARLAMPFSCPLPLTVGVAPNGINAPVPSAGPYYIADWVRGREIVVKENPNYGGARPHHFDEIHYGIGQPLETIKQQIDEGTTDWGDIPPASHAELDARFGPCTPTTTPTRQRYLCYSAPTVLYLAMNHDRPLFGAGGPLGNVNLKKAVNYAIDRTAIMEQRGVNGGRTTDQHLPFGVPGFRDVEIYPSRPDLVRARQLAGCTGDAPDTCPQRQGVFYCSNRAPAPQQCQIVQENLRQIGLEMEIMLFPRAIQFERAGHRGEPFDMTLEAWHAEYLDPFTFLALLDGTTLQPFNNVNFAYFDDSGYSDRIAAANRLLGAARWTAFGDLDIDLARDAAPWAAYGVPNDRFYFSDQVGCQTYSPAYTLDLAALCIRPAISIDDVTVSEGDAGTRTATFTVTLAEAASTDYPVTVSYATSDGSAGGADYASTAGELTFNAMQQTKTIDVQINGDTSVEPDETFGIHLSETTKGTIIRANGIGTISNDDAAPAPPPPPPTDTQAPVDPSLSSTTHRIGVASTLHTVQIQLSGAQDNLSGVDGFSFAWDRLPETLPDTQKDAEEDASETTSPVLANGRWYFHLRTRDNAGNWSSAAHLGPFVIISRRPVAVCVVPNVRGMTVGRAGARLASRGCSLGRVTRAFSKRVRSGRVVTQSRRPGVRVSRGTRVHVVVSRGRRR